MTETHFNPRSNLPLTPYTVPLILWDVIENTWADERVTFTEAYPQTKTIKGPVIVWKIYRRLPGWEGVETYKPRSRGWERSTTDPGTVIDVMAQRQTVIYQFDIFAQDNQTANDLMLRLENLLFHITPTLQAAGVSHWVFDEQLEDVETQTRMSQELSRRTLRYRCFLERRFTRQLPTIHRIWIRPLEGDLTVINERVTRSALQPYDTLANSWLTEMIAVDAIPVVTTTSSGCYIEEMDFYITVEIDGGESRINWIAGRKHPAPGEEYFVTYKYSISATPVEVNDPPRTVITTQT